MAFVNFGKHEISFKIVYYGPPLCGKTTNLEYLHRSMPAGVHGDMTMLSTREDRTLYFDFLPLRSEAIKGYVSRFQLYTVPGQTVYDQTRRIVLTGADGIVFVADSQWDRMEHNAESLANLKDNLGVHGRSLRDTPCLLQFNKRDLPNVAPADYLDFLLNQGDVRLQYVEAAALKGSGVRETLNLLCRMVMAQFVEANKARAPETAALR
jgi:mutual gliding-motility protein MglA